MLIVSDLINNKTQIVESLKKRNKDFSKEIDLVIDFDKKRRTTQSELDQILSQQNQLSKRIGEYYKSGDQSSGNELKKQVEALKPKVKKLEKNLNEIKSELLNSFMTDLSSRYIKAANESLSVIILSLSLRGVPGLSPVLFLSLEEIRETFPLILIATATFDDPNRKFKNINNTRAVFILIPLQKVFQGL